MEPKDTVLSIGEALDDITNTTRVRWRIPSPMRVIPNTAAASHPDWLLY